MGGGGGGGGGGIADYPLSPLPLVGFSSACDLETICDDKPL